MRLFVICALLSLMISPAVAEDFTVDGKHAYVLFSVDHLGIAPNWGRFNQVSGDLSFSADTAKNTIKLQINMASVDTANKKRDSHIRGPDFFDVKQFPYAEFKSSQWKKVDEHTFEVTGHITVRGVKRPLVVQVKKTGQGKDPWGNFRIGFTTEFEFDRMAHGIAYMPKGLGKTVKMVISLEGVRRPKPTESPKGK